MKLMKSYTKRIAAMLLALTMGCSAMLAAPAEAKKADKAEKEKPAVSAAEVSSALEDVDSSAAITYAEYLALHGDAVAGKGKVQIPATGYTAGSAALVKKTFTDYEGNKGTSVQFADNGTSSFNFSVEADGFYTVKFNYFADPESNGAIVRNILIDGALPFAESAEVSLPIVWSDESVKKKYDKLNNEVRSKQIKVGTWRTAYAEDVTGYNCGELKYFLTAGSHTISLQAQNECLHLGYIEIAGVNDKPSYKEVLAQYKDKGYKNVKKAATITVQAEDAKAYRSEQTLCALNDRTSPAVEPYDVNLVRYNIVGNTHWELAGQWIEWTVDVKETGLYNIATHYRQNLKTNDVSVREIYIDGELPFKEADSLYFYYDNAWQTTALGEKGKDPYLFYLEKGKHTIRLEVGMGGAADFLARAKTYLNTLNHIYRKIVMVTGVEPDTYRDYHLDIVIGDTMKEMAETSKKLKALEKEVSKFNGQGGASTVHIKRLYEQMDTLVDDSDKVASNLSSFQSNIASFGTWINDETIQPIELDYIMLSAPKEELPAGEKNFFATLWHYILQFLYSFVTDYEAVGIMDDNCDSELTVWLTSGRDQAAIIKQLINDDFTPNNNVAANLQLITPAALLPSILAGTGPDVYTGITQGEPINLALRKALCNLKQFKDYDEVSKRFAPQCITPFTFEGGVYALPDTMDYSMLYVRTDILKELNISVDKLNDWDTILSDVLPVLQMNSLSFGVPTGIYTYLMYLYQNGGQMYTNNGKNCAFASAEAIEAMTTFSELYTQYSFNLAYDFANRFRSGEIPMAIANISAYNQLSVFAPDINGLWTMLPIPGTYNKEGKLDRSNVATVTGTIIMKDTEDKQAAWKYLKWWNSAEIQHEYGGELESILGSAARYNTANIEAFKNISWNRKMKTNLVKQIDWLKPYYEVPGSYITTRYFDFAFRYIVYDGDNVRDTLIENVESIDREIAHKRDEYNLD